MTQRDQIRQGDVLLIPIDSIPAIATPLPAEQGRLILAHGEATGHHHSVAASPTIALLTIRDGAGPNREMYLLIKEGEALLEHQEHAPHVVSGAYEVRRQRELSATQRDWRFVED